MKEKPLLIQIRPRCFERWRALPIFGPLLDEFLPWLRAQSYAKGTISGFLDGIPKVVSWLRRHRITVLAQLTQQDLQIALDHYRRRREKSRWVVGALARFLEDRQLVEQGEIPAPSSVEAEVASFESYLQETRGLAAATIKRHASHLRAFLKFLRIDRDPARLQRLQLCQVEKFLTRAARTNNRFSLQQIVATVRAFLRHQHAQGLQSRPLHQQIDTPRVYRGERLPKALPWSQVLAFVRSIDRSGPFGRRDFTLVYLAAAYGLRSCELVCLTLDDIDWRGRILRVRQTKTRQTLQLPLTDEAGGVLIDYLREARPDTALRELFLRMRAPIVPLKPASVHDVLEHRIHCSGLDLPSFGMHVLRHSFATRLMGEGVNIKSIGDALGHRDIESTSVYLRLNVADLRNVPLSVPPIPAEGNADLLAQSSVPQIRPARPPHNLPAQLGSHFAPSLRRFIELKRALGRIYKGEAAILAHWDDYIHRQYPRARRVRAEMFTEWSRMLVHLTSTGSRHWQRVLRSFLLFHSRDHADTFIPDRLTFPKAAPGISPRLISEAEMGRVLAVASQLPPSADNPIRRETFRIGLILLFCCGLRRGELLRLRLGDIQQEQTLLDIRPSKFHKSRLLPLSKSVTLEMRRYLQTREQRTFPMAPESFLMWSRQRSPEVYAATALSGIWHRLCVSAHVVTDQGHPPRLHDIRHSCAVLALQRWYAQGVDVQAKLPHLATYLGHVSPVSTHHYLKLTPELRQVASQRFHQRFAPLLTSGGVA